MVSQREVTHGAGIILSVVGLGGLCFLLFRCAAYALPTFVGFAAGFWAFDSGAGPIGAIAVGAIAGGAALGACRLVFGLARNEVLRALIALAFAAPAAYAGYHIVFGLAYYGVTSEIWRHVFAVVGAGAIGLTAAARLAVPVSALREADGP
jgi:hypothetical protein